MNRPAQETYRERKERERNDPASVDSQRGPGHETYDEQLERYRREWRDVIDRDLYR